MLRIYHTSDLHDRRGIASRLRELRAREPGLLFDSGDSLRGSQTIYYRNEPIVDEMAAAGYDAQAIGNREFHYLFGAVRARAARMPYPLVCTNLRDTRTRPLPFVPSLQFQIDGNGTSSGRVVVFGLLVVQYPAQSFWEHIFGWRFVDPIAALEPFLQSVTAHDCVVVLSHLGLRSDRELARRLPRIDLLLGGHSHDRLPVPEYVGDVPIVHAGPYGQWVSRTNLAYESARHRFAVSDFALLPLRRVP